MLFFKKSRWRQIILNKKISILLFLIIIIFSISTVQAKDVNAIDSGMNITNENIQLSNANDADSLGSIGDAPVSENAKNQTEFISPTDSIYYSGCYNVTLRDSNSNATLPNKTVNLVIDDVSHIATTDDNGVASVNLNLNPGNYVACAYFDGNDAYESSNLTNNFKVLSTIKASNLSKYYKGATQYSATFFNSQGIVLSNTYVNITVNGKLYTKKTNGAGIASLPVNLKPGTYKIVATDPVTGYELTTKFKILSTVVSSSFKKVLGDSKKFHAKFYRNDGKALSNKYVKLEINGKIQKVKTNSYGNVYMSLNKFKIGTHKFVCYSPDGLSKTVTVKIYKYATSKLTTKFYTLLPNDKKVIAVKLTTSLGDDSNSGKVVKIQINGKTYSRKTDSEGVINFKLPSLNNGLYVVKYSYGGTKFVKASKATNFVTILDNSKTSLTVKSTKTFGYGAGTLFKVAYAVNGVPLIKRAVSLKIAGKTYSRTTDVKGIASIPINLKIGSYTFNYSTKDETKLNGTSGSCDVKVVKRNSSALTWKCGVSFKDSLQTFKVLLTDSKGNPVSRGIVELTIDGETYNGTTSSTGYATIKTSVPIGKYKVKVKFIGNNELLPTSTSNSIDVKLSKFGNGLNQKNTISYLKAYLQSSAHCKVGNSKIKALVKSLTKGLTNKIDKAKAIFNYVRDTLEYSMYYNTKYGAVGTYKAKKGNCVDHAHLLVSMYRTAGFKARYVHGVCHFIKSGHTYGHVWTQVLIDKTWVCGDPTDYCNDLGKIKSWDTKSYKVHAKYRSLPF